MIPVIRKFQGKWYIGYKNIFRDTLHVYLMPFQKNALVKAVNVQPLEDWLQEKK